MALRCLFTTAEARDAGLTAEDLRRGVRRRFFRAVGRGVYADGPGDPTPLDWARADALRGNAAARGHLAGVLHGLDAVTLAGPPTRRERLPIDRIVLIGDQPCADGCQTLIDLAATLDDARWEQALESALRKGLTSVEELASMLDPLGRSRVTGTARIRRVLAVRPPGAPPTESLLETLGLQLAREVPGLGELDRQVVVRDDHDHFVARLDLAKPTIGFFMELDGQGFHGQPVYDAMRETAVVAATGWLPGRFTWTEMTRLRNSTRRRLAALEAQARRRWVA